MKRKYSYLNSFNVPLMLMIHDPPHLLSGGKFFKCPTVWCPMKFWLFFFSNSQLLDKTVITFWTITVSLASTFLRFASGSPSELEFFLSDAVTTLGFSLNDMSLLKRDCHAKDNILTNIAIYNLFIWIVTAEWTDQKQASNLRRSIYLNSVSLQVYMQVFISRTRFLPLQPNPPIENLVA